MSRCRAALKCTGPSSSSRGNICTTDWLVGQQFTTVSIDPTWVDAIRKNHYVTVNDSMYVLDVKQLFFQVPVDNMGLIILEAVIKLYLSLWGLQISVPALHSSVVA